MPNNFGGSQHDKRYKPNSKSSSGTKVEKFPVDKWFKTARGMIVKRTSKKPDAQGLYPITTQSGMDCKIAGSSLVTPYRVVKKKKKAVETSVPKRRIIKKKKTVEQPVKRRIVKKKRKKK